MIRTLALLCVESRGRIDAIRDATVRLAGALADRGTDVAVVMRRSDSTWTSGDCEWPGLPAVASDFGIVVIAYNPFSYGRRGFAPWLIRDLGLVRLRRRRPTIVLYLHETAMPLSGWRKTLMGLWQRVQLRALLVVADVVLATTEAWTTQVANSIPHRPATHLPAASNLPDMRRRREEMRSQLGVDRHTLVVATLSNGHESHLVDYVSAAVACIGKETRDVFVLLLGAGARVVNTSGLAWVRPGQLVPDELAAHIAASDLFLAPFIDGASTRRTSLMSALQHGVAAVSTDGPLTDSILRTGAVALTSVGDVAAFAAAASRLGTQDSDRARLGTAGRVLYERFFDWPILAARVTAAAETGRADGVAT